MKAKSKN